ncbi:MAG: hypothetical protein COB41_10340 [Proteobacteria bacterium]|nr:MAG: hypothetical protein COB41_10340 [Pseudomonadota bacterium]
MIVLESAIWIWLSGLLFAVSHSLVASLGCKQWAYAHGLQEPRYRLLYSIIALLATGVWVFFVHQLEDAPLYQTDGLLWVVMVGVQVVGLIVALAAFQPIDGLVFLGLRKAKVGTDPFIISGIYRWVRHPMYTGAMLILLAMPEQSWNGLMFSLVLCVYFVIGSHFEEQRMLAEHSEYASYQRSVPAFIPRRSLKNE